MSEFVLCVVATFAARAAYDALRWTWRYAVLARAKRIGGRS